MERARKLVINWEKIFAKDSPNKGLLSEIKIKTRIRKPSH
jgi:hypothetical protein